MVFSSLFRRYFAICRPLEVLLLSSSTDYVSHSQHYSLYSSLSLVSPIHDEEDCWDDDSKRLVFTSSHLVYTNLSRMVYHQWSSGMAQRESKRVHLCRQQGLCGGVKFYLLLDTWHCHDYDVLSYIQVNLDIPVNRFVCRIYTVILCLLCVSPKGGCSTKEST